MYHFTYIYIYAFHVYVSMSLEQFLEVSLLCQVYTCLNLISVSNQLFLRFVPVNNFISVSACLPKASLTECAVIFSDFFLFFFFVWIFLVKIKSQVTFSFFVCIFSTSCSTFFWHWIRLWKKPESQLNQFSHFKEIGF